MLSRSSVRGRWPSAPGAGARPLNPKYVHGQVRTLLQGAAAGPLHPRAGASPLDPKMMPPSIQRLARMPSSFPQQLSMPSAWRVTEAERDHIFLSTGLFAGGVLGDKRSAGDGLAWVPLVGGAGATRPASSTKTTDS